LQIRNNFSGLLHKEEAFGEAGSIFQPMIERIGDPLDAARRLDFVSRITTGTRAPKALTQPLKESANLLHFNSGPVAQLDRAAVS
jgi:hypothetical protein